MTTTIGTNGRFCNHFIRNICVSMIAKVHDLAVTYSYAYEMQSLGIILYSGSRKYNMSMELTDVNFLYYLNTTPCVTYNFLLYRHTYFQTKAISNLLHNYLHSPEIRDPIIMANKYSGRYNNNNEVFVHVRLGDVAYYNPGFAYYNKVLEILSNNNPSCIYISSDSIDDPICKTIISRFNAKIIDYDFIDTLKFASTCKYLVLSHGSFSATMGNLAFYSEIYYPKYDQRKIWYGDMFTGNGWNEVSF